MTTTKSGRRAVSGVGARAAVAAGAAAWALAGCGGSTPSSTDAGVTTDAPVTLMCPTAMVPDPDQQTLPCCYRASQADQLASPEARLRYLDINAPAASPLATPTVIDLLNGSLQREVFNWLFRVEGADGDGAITITTGVGRRAADGTYAFSTGAAGGDPDSYLPVTLDGTITGEEISTGVLDGTITVPIFDDTGTTLQFELKLHSLQVEGVTLSNDRSCIGSLLNARGRFQTAATLSGYILVSEARESPINVPGVMGTLCGVVAGSVTSATYCDDNAQASWTVPPDSLCDMTGCRLDPGDGTVCTDATCNAWRLEADFAAVGVDVTN